jgi:hypothetical protein
LTVFMYVLLGVSGKAIIGSSKPLHISSSSGFPPARLTAGYGFRKETIARMRRNGRDAPIAAIRQTPVNRLRTTCLAMMSPFR